jgi:hypothetical protein
MIQRGHLTASVIYRYIYLQRDLFQLSMSGSALRQVPYVFEWRTMIREDGDDYSCGIRQDAWRGAQEDAVCMHSSSIRDFGAA